MGQRVNSHFDFFIHDFETIFQARPTVNSKECIFDLGLHPRSTVVT